MSQVLCMNFIKSPRPAQFSCNATGDSVISVRSKVGRGYQQQIESKKFNADANILGAFVQPDFSFVLWNAQRWYSLGKSQLLAKHMAEECNPYVVQPVMKAMGVLAYVLEQGHIVSLKSVSDAMNLPKTTTFRYLQTLTATGFLEHDVASGKYKAASRFHSISVANVVVNKARQLARPLMLELTKEFSATVNLAVKGDCSVVYLDVMSSTHGTGTNARTGDAHPLHSTALGKAILAFMPEQEKQQYLSLSLAERTGRTLIERHQLEDQLHQVRRTGYAIETGENEDGMMCVGAPILDDSGYPWVAISITVPQQFLSTHHAMQVGTQLLAASQDISARLGLSLRRITAA